MQILISNEAQNDLESIYTYISSDSILYANKTLKNIYACISELQHTPYLGKHIPEILNKNFRELVYKNYRIIYEISESSNIIYIHFIIHSRRNFKSIIQSYINNLFILCI